MDVHYNLGRSIILSNVV